MGVGSVKMSFSDPEPHCTHRGPSRCPGALFVAGSCKLVLHAGQASAARRPHASHAADAIGRWILQVVGVCGVEMEKSWWAAHVHACCVSPCS